VACAVIPAVAVHAAWLMSRAGGHVPDCIPHIEGCTSISRAARHGAGNLVFKALMIPAAALQAWNWIAASRWIEGRARLPGAERGIVPLGIVAGIALAVYASFLGSEGWLHGWLRRYGITFYFAATFLAMLVFVRQLRSLSVAPRLAAAMAWTCAAMLALGCGNVVAPLFGADEALRERIRDAMEWQLGGLFTLWFLLQARALR
jgi:hypothetical protein